LPRTDTYRHKGMRRQLVEVLRHKGIQDERVLQAIGRLPRHWFLDQAFADWAYRNLPFAIGCGQTISHPHTVAFQTQLLRVSPRDKILEIGTGSGYQSAVLQMIGGRVWTIERHHALHLESRALLEDLGFGQIRSRHGDGYLGWPTEGPFDRILVTAGADHIPRRLVDQLKWGGRMVIPVGDDSAQEMIVVDKDRYGKVRQSRHGAFAFVPFLSGTDDIVR